MGPRRARTCGVAKPYDISLACECGSALKLSGGTEAQNSRVVMSWSITHAGKDHGRCSPAEARKIRMAARERAAGWTSRRGPVRGGNGVV